MSSFLSEFDIATYRKPLPLVAKCGVCRLHENCRSPKMKVDGKGKRKILIVGESPGTTEDEEGIPFVGESGQLLEKTFDKFGIDLREDCWMTNAIICHPPKNEIPPKAIEYCQPNLIQAVRSLNPTAIFLFGASPVKSLLTWLFKKDIRGIGRWIGWKIPCQSINSWIFPFWHPDFILRTDYGVSGQERGRGNDVREMVWQNHIRSAILKAKKGKPYASGKPDYKVSCLVNVDVAVDEIDKMRKSGVPIAWDLECDRIKPERKDSRIVSCGLSDGNRAIAYPWTGDTAEATLRLLKSSKVPKIAHNFKYDARWIKAVENVWVRNWHWDTMIAAHVLDNRSEIVSLKFQAFVELGAETWDDHVKPYMKSSGSNEPNRITEIPLAHLLRYNALDALLTWKLYEKQAKRMKVSP